MFYLLAEGATIVDHIKLVVADVAFAKGCIAHYCLIGRLESCFIVVIVEFDGAVRRRHHMNDCLVAVIAKLDFSPTHPFQNTIE